MRARGPALALAARVFVSVLVLVFASALVSAAAPRVARAQARTPARAELLPIAVTPPDAALAAELDAVLADLAQDLFVLDLDAAPRAPGSPRDEGALGARARATGAFVVAPSLRGAVAGGAGALELRVAIGDPRSGAVAARIERIERIERAEPQGARTKPAELGVRFAVLLRAVAHELDAGERTRVVPRARRPGGAVVPAKSEGRTALAVNATLYGGVAGYAIQRSSGSSDPRLLYPLLAVGAGVGLGASVLVAQEWNVTPSAAWFLSAGAWWPTLAGQLSYAGRFGDGTTERTSARWGFGLAYGVAGLGLATVVVAAAPVTEGDAVLAHTGAALGFALGALGEIGATGELGSAPLAGMGVGTALGWLAGAAGATLVDPRPGQVLVVGAGALLGGLGGAALASPVLFADDAGASARRGWAAAAGGGAIAGGVIAAAMVASRGPVRSPASASASGSAYANALRLRSLPAVGVIGESRDGARRAPVLGVRVDLEAGI